MKRLVLDFGEDIIIDCIMSDATPPELAVARSLPRLSETSQVLATYSVFLLYLHHISHLPPISSQMEMEIPL
jgi:hypothetical protein